MINNACMGYMECFIIFLRMSVMKLVYLNFLKFATLLFIFEGRTMYSLAFKTAFDCLANSSSSSTEKVSVCVNTVT